MGWVVEFIVGWIWDDVIHAVYKRYGWFVATLAFLAPFLIIALLIGTLILLAR